MRSTPSSRPPHAAGIAALRPGISARDLDTRVPRRVRRQAGHLDWYLHGTGHGVGLEIHESPFHSQASDEVIIAGNVVTVEPGLYRVGFGGFRIEDLLVVTETGSQPLTHTVPRPISGLNARPKKTKDTTMPQISVNDLKNGITLELDNGLFQVIEFQHVKPGKGGAFVRTKIRNLRNGAVIDKTFNAGIKVEQAIVDRQDMQFLYKDGTDYVFMNTSTYDQMNVPSSALGEAADYLTEQMVAQIAQYHGEIIGVEIPASVELLIAETEPGVQGDRVSGARKPATLETGKVLQVPLFVEPGDKVKVDTRTGDYLTRV